MGRIEKEHRKETLMRWSKEELAEHIMCLEHNYNNILQSFDQQYINVMRLLDDMKIVNDTYKESRKYGIKQREHDESRVEAARQMGFLK